MIGHRIDQELSSERRAAARIAQPERRGGREIANCAVAGERQARRIGAEFCGMRRRPAHGKDAIVEPSREFVLGRQAIID
jgi:hypothetical protein